MLIKPSNLQSNSCYTSADFTPNKFVIYQAFHSNLLYYFPKIAENHQFHYICISNFFPLKKRSSLSQSVSYLPYQTTLNIFCDIGFSFFCSTSACAFLNSSIRFNSSSASSNYHCTFQPYD